MDCSIQLTSLEEIFDLEGKQNSIKQVLSKKRDIIDTYRCTRTGESYRVDRKKRKVVEVIRNL